MPATSKDQSSPQPEDTEKPDSKQVEEPKDEQTSATAENKKEEELNGTEKGEESETKEREQPDDTNPPLPDEPVPSQNEWQAIWSPAHNAYYFFNSRTSETTWVNPLDPTSTPATTTAQPEPEPESKDEQAPTTDEQPPADLSYLNGIDPELAYLDPTLAVPSGGAKGPVPTFSARFGARDGKFTAMDGRRPEHLSEAARAQRMSAVYYDTEAWEREIAERDAKAKAEAEAGAGDKRKRVTKADIERFKAQKKAKQAMRNAWLRE
ncbi:hypothetical protein RSOLAG22IIIB_10493 [Rhizoctonia solani]|uniref:WW domain-containing protein n=1 Tax=Rhizoctonia solani TaxID=456999 RepID=A0A0K6G3U1_9AGAM|nr:hypothetical protein RSOLAG22IIIB_10493 [Rhizoctonia solani]